MGDRRCSTGDCNITGHIRDWYFHICVGEGTGVQDTAVWKTSCLSDKGVHEGDYKIFIRGIYPAVGNESGYTDDTGAGKQFRRCSYGCLYSGSQNRFFCLYACTGIWECVFPVHIPESRRRERRQDPERYQAGFCSFRSVLRSDLRTCVSSCKGAYAVICLTV